MIDKNLERLRVQTLAFESQLDQCTSELDALSDRLTELRNRQKQQFGELLLRTTLNKPLIDLIRECGEEEEAFESSQTAEDSIQP